MSKKLLLVIVPLVIVLAIVALFTIPFGIKVGDAKEKFVSIQSNISSLSTSFNTNQEVAAYCKFAEDIKSYYSTLDELDKSIVELNEEANFLKTIWKKNDLNAEDIKGQREVLIQMVLKTNEKTLSVFKNTCDKTSNSFNKSTSSVDINSTTNDFKLQLSNLNTCLFTINNFIKSPEFQKTQNTLDVNLSLLKDKSDMIQNVAKIGISKLENIISTNQNNFNNKLESTNSVKEINSLSRSQLDHLSDSKSSLISLSSFGQNISFLKSCERTIDNSVNSIKNDLNLVDKIIQAQNRSNEIMKRALSKADDANNSLNRLEKFAESSQIYNVYSDWASSLNEARQSRSALNMSTSNQHQRKIYDNLMSRTTSNVNQIVSRIEDHTNFVSSEYRKAQQEESNWASNISRATQRVANRAMGWLGERVEEVSESRVGHEIGLSVKVLILGTKVFFDLMDPNTNPLSWAMSYQGDVEQLMSETDEVMRMEGPSITGKNTFIKDLTNRAYNEAYRK